MQNEFRDSQWHRGYLTALAELTGGSRQLLLAAPEKRKAIPVDFSVHPTSVRVEGLQLGGGHAVFVHQRLFGPQAPDYWHAEHELKKRRSCDRARLREARFWGDDDYAEIVQARIEHQTERIADCREEQEVEIEGEEAPRKRRGSPTADDARKGIEVVIRIQLAALRSAPGNVQIAEQIGRLEGMAAALIGGAA